MGTNMNFKCFGNEPPPEGSGSGRPSGNFNFPLARQSSIYSLTFDEFRSSLGKEFGSMNMDELLKSIWTAEETQNMASTAAGSVVGGGGHVGGNQGGYLQRQGSLTLPRTLSQRTVDEMWRDMSKEFSSGKDAGTAANVPESTQRQPTLGEITLEEFLVRAGVVREDAQLAEKANPGGFLGDFVQPNANNTGFGIDFQQPNHGVGLMDNSSQVPLQLPNLAANVNGARSSQQQPMTPQMPQQQQQQQQQQPQQLQQPPIFPKQNAVSYAPTMSMLSSTQLGSSGMRGGVAGFTNQTTDVNVAQGFGLQGGAMGVATGSPTTLSSDGLAKRNGDRPYVSPLPYVFNGGIRGRKSNNTVEKVVERRQKRMIKNRESAARSRARKQAYTTELEEEVAKLKEENEELKRKEAEIKEMHKKQILEMMKSQYGYKKRCLRRTQTGLW